MSFYIKGLDNILKGEKEFEAEKDKILDSIARFVYSMNEDEKHGLRQFIKELGAKYKEQRIQEEIRAKQKELFNVRLNIGTDLVWSDDSQKFITIPDGDEATHEQIKRYFERR